MRYQFRLLAEVILFKIYDALFDDKISSIHNVANIQKMFSISVPVKIIEASINHLRTFDPRLVLRSGKQGAYVYKISPDGILFVEESLKNASSLIAYYASHGDEGLSAVASFDAIFSIQNELSQSSEWAPITIDRNSQSYHDAMIALIESIDAIKKHNEFAAKFPAERDAILESLETGKSRLEDGKITKHGLRNYILSPLRWIGSTFAKSALSAFASDAAHKLIQLLSHIL